MKHHVHSRKMHNRLSGLTWNAGARRQAIDISLFAAGTWSYIILQELHPLEVDRLQSLQYSVVAAPETGLAIAMPLDFLREAGEVVEVVERTLESGQWAMKAMFAQFQLDVPDEWSVRTLVLGSFHVNNWVASHKPGITRELLQELFYASRRTGCDVLGGDLNQALSQWSTELRLWVQKEDLQPVATSLLGHRPGDCCGFALLPGSCLLSQNLQRHGTISFHHQDIGIRLYDADSHYPGFMFHSMSSKRTRGAMSQTRLDRQERKQMKLHEKRASKQARGNV